MMPARKILAGLAVATLLVTAIAWFGRSGSGIPRPPNIPSIVKFAGRVAPRSRSTDPLVNAAQAARLGDFRLSIAGQGPLLPEGVICFTPGGRPNGVLERLNTGDYITPEVSRQRAYIEAYNQAIVESPSFPDADICRTRQPHDPWSRGSPLLVTMPARTVTAPPHSLHEAARRGSAAAVRSFLWTTPANLPDGTGMTPLAWAVARNNLPAIAVLLDNGEDPWAGEHNSDHPAIYWAAATGRKDLFDRLRRYPRPRALKSWPESWLGAAIESGNAAIVETMVAEGHEPLTAATFFLQYSAPEPAALEPLLRGQIPGLADAALTKALRDDVEINLDLVSLALKYHANPNGTGKGATPLGLAVSGFRRTPEAVDLLLKAGADVNRRSPRDLTSPRSPIWYAVETLRTYQEGGPDYDRALAIVKRMIAAGADLTLPDAGGRPPIWFLLTRSSIEGDLIDPSRPISALLPMLVKLGMNPNAPWQGRTILDLVEHKLGRTAPLALALRAVGAR
jgi:hypothetical protein